MCELQCGVNIMKYDVERYYRYYDLCEFLIEANNKGYEIISMTETIDDYAHCYTILYRRPTE